MNNFLFKLKPSGKDWVLLGISLGALVLAVLAFLGALFSLGTFFVQKELPWQMNTSWFSNDLSLKNLNKLDLTQSAPNNLQNLQDQVAVLGAELEALKAASLKSQAVQSQSGNNIDLASVQMAKMDLHLALSLLQEGGDLKLILGFLNNAEQELLLGHRLVESKLLGSVIENVRNNQADLNNFMGLKNHQAGLNNLIKNLGALSFNLPINPQTLHPVSVSGDLETETGAETGTKSVGPHEGLWKSGLRQSFERIKSLLIIRDNQTVGENLLLDSSRKALTASIIFDLQNAQSLLAGSQWMAYEQVLSQVGMKIKINFQDNAQSQNWLNNLNALQITPALTEATAIQAALLKILEDLNSGISEGASA